MTEENDPQQRKKEGKKNEWYLSRAQSTEREREKKKDTRTHIHVKK